MESKMERRPNVRLEELGEFPAAVACVPKTPWAGLSYLKLDEADSTQPPELDFFGAITRKSRITNRSGRTAMGSNRVFADPGGTDRVRDCTPCGSSVSRWLEGNGFGMYAGVFEMHEVDEDALTLLTIQDLKEMGVSAVGHRRKLYEAIRRMDGDHSTWSEDDAD